MKENKKPMSISSVTDTIESVVKQVADEIYDANTIPINSIIQSESTANKFSKYYFCSLGTR